MTDNASVALKADLSGLDAHSLLVGFAYSLTPDGFPGKYNEKIADRMKDAINKVKERDKPEDRPWIGMQWEIFDALESKVKEQKDDNLLDLLRELVPFTHVAGPPLFDRDDIKNPEVIVAQLKAALSDSEKEKAGQPLTKASTKAARILAKRIAQDLKKIGYRKDPEGDIFDAAMFDNVKLIQYFNRLLDDPYFYNNFYVELFYYVELFPVVELHDLYRTNLGSIGVERRQLPEFKPDSPLGRFQKLRVNRLILEAIFPDEEVLKRGEYLSTRGVLEKLLPKAKRDKDIKYAYVFGHPKHSPRCRRQLIESAWEAGLRLNPNNVLDVMKLDAMKGRVWDWDTTTAQMWCRTDQNWKDYERMGRARLH